MKEMKKNIALVLVLLAAGTAFAGPGPRKNSRTEMGIHGPALYVIEYTYNLRGGAGGGRQLICIDSITFDKRGNFADKFRTKADDYTWYSYFFDVNGYSLGWNEYNREKMLTGRTAYLNDKDGNRIERTVFLGNQMTKKESSKFSNGLKVEEQSFDSDGEMAAEGRVVEPLLRQMEALEYYRLDAPKSLGKEWFEAQFEPLLSTGRFSVADMLRTTVEHIAGRVADVVNANNIRSMLVSGGGARNRFLIERLREVSPGCNITVPRPEIIDYKEAVIFALLGYLRLEKKPNCLNSVTGARCSCIGGNVSGYW